MEDVRAGVAVAIPYIAATGVKRVHLMAGNADRREAGAVSAYRAAVAWTAERLAPEGVDLVLEPINGRNMPGYFLDDFAFAIGLIEDLALPNLKLQFDIYHRQILHGDVATALRHMMSVVGHVQVASVPSRHEPDSEELSYPFLFGELDRLGYDGFVGCEYVPRAGTLAGLGWFSPYAVLRAGRSVVDGRP